MWDEIEPDKNDKDELKELLSSERPGKSFYLPEHQDVNKCREVIIEKHPQWISGGDERPPADPYIIAHAMVLDMVVVTEEKRQGEGQGSEPKIPNVCSENSVESVPLLELFRREGWRF